ncbi:MAG TPA: superoxide dismutase family protein [Allosphingosinicella sp.]|jgi:Cu-Zn family superoxide dismutase
MRQAGLLLITGAALATAACATEGDPTEPAATADSGPIVSTIGPPALNADLRDAQGRSRARATVEQSGDSLRVRIEATGMTAGAYGAHIHTTGRCDAPAFTTAGPHWNPTGQMHGKDNPKGMHKGDLPNLMVGADGRGSLEYTIPHAILSGMLPTKLVDEDGAAVVIHARADDYRTDPSGNSGDRIACGVLG